MTVKRADKTTLKVIDEYTYRIWIKGGFKLDVSGGFFISTLTDKVYTVRDYSSQEPELKTIAQKDIGKYSFGIGSLLNLSYRTGASWIKPAISAGIIFSNSQKFQILAGPALVLGKEQRIILHYGCAMGTTTRLDNNYLADGKTAYKLGAVNTAPTMEKFSFGHYFGLTYNFSPVKTAKPVTEGE